MLKACLIAHDFVILKRVLRQQILMSCQGWKFYQYVTQNQHKHDMMRTVQILIGDKAFEIDREKNMIEGECGRKCHMMS